MYLMKFRRNDNARLIMVLGRKKFLAKRRHGDRNKTSRGAHNIVIISVIPIPGSRGVVKCKHLAN